MVKKILIVLFFVVLVFWAGRVWLWPASKGTQTYKVERRDLEIATELSGKVRAVNEVSLSFPILGRLEFVASLGATLKSGEVVARLSSGELWAGLQQSFANLNKARSTFYYHLEVKSETDATYAWKEDAVSKAKVNQANNNVAAAQDGVEAAQFAVDAARAVLGKAFVKAPFSGVVGSVFLKVGEVAGVAAPVASFLDPTAFYFEVDVDEIDVGGLTLGQAANVKIDAVAGQEFGGGVYQIDLTAHPTAAGGTAYRVKISLPKDAEGQLRSGLNGEARIIKEVRPLALVVPASFVVSREGKSYLRLAIGGRTVEREVTLGEFVDGVYEVLDGVGEGDLVSEPPR